MPDVGGEPLMSARVDVVADTSKADAALQKMQSKLIAAAEKAAAAAQKALDKQIASLEREAIAAEKKADRAVAARDREAAAAEKAANRAAAAAEKAAEREAAAFARADAKAQAGVRAAMAGGDAAGRESVVYGMMPGRSDGKAGRGGASAPGGPGTAEGVKAIGIAASNSSYKIQVLGQVLDDLQYVPQMGLRPILNNIMQFSPILGIATLAVDQLAKAFGGWGKIINLGHTKTEAERMEELAKATEHVADSQAKLTKMKRDEAAVEAQAGSQTTQQTTQAKTVREAISEGGEAAVVKGLVEGSSDHLTRTNIGASNAKTELDEESKSRLFALMSMQSTKGWTGEMYQKEVERTPSVMVAQAKYEDALNKAARQLLGQAENSPAKLDLLIKRVEKNPGAFPKDFASSLKEATPAGQQAIKDWEQQGEDFQAGIDTGKIKKAAREERERKIDEEAGKRFGSFEQKYGASIVGTQKGGTFDRDELKAKLRKELLEGGVKDDEKLGSMTEHVAKKLLKSIEDKVEDYSISHNVDRGTAQEAVKQTMEQDQAKKLKAELAARMGDFKPQLHSIDSYLSSIQQRANDAKDPVSEAVKTGNKILEKIAENTAKRAVATYK